MFQLIFYIFTTQLNNLLIEKLLQIIFWTKPLFQSANNQILLLEISFCRNFYLIKKLIFFYFFLRKKFTSKEGLISCILGLITKTSTNIYSVLEGKIGI